MRARRSFRPVLDFMPSRLALSGASAAIDPMDPVSGGGSPPAIVDPMDPTSTSTGADGVTTPTPTESGSFLPTRRHEVIC